MSSRAAVQRGFAALERDREALLLSLAGRSREWLRRKPAVGSWCAVEVVDHLVRVERGILRLMRENVGRQNGTSVQGGFRNAVLLTVMVLPIRVKVPKSASAVKPGEPREAEELAAEWAATRRELDSFIGSLSEPDLRKGLFRHPRGDWMSAHWVLRFLRAHLHHHRYQLRRLKRVN